MDIGLYSNLFQVTFTEQEAFFMVTERRNYPVIRDLRHQISAQNLEAGVYALDDDLFGYGKQQKDLETFGFVGKEVNFAEIPALCSRLILEGYVASLVAAEYTNDYSMGRACLYQFGRPLLSLTNGVKLFRGVEISTLFLLDPENESLAYFVVVDPVFTYRSPENQPINTHDVVTRFGNDTLQQLRTKQGDLSPHGGINLEISRQRLSDFVLPFIAARHKFTLPCWSTPVEGVPSCFGIEASIQLEPVRIVMAE